MNAPDPTRPGAEVSDRWARWRAGVDLGEYAVRWDRQAAAGADVHGEADLVASFEPGSVLDAGCGNGRVAIELARRGIEAVGVDLDDDLLALARRRAPELAWHRLDLATMGLGRRFDAIVQAGNVLNFCRPADRAPIVATSAEHLTPGGRLIVGFSVESEPDGRSTNAELHVANGDDAGLELEAHWSSWDGRPPDDDPGYAVFVHRRPGG